MRRFLFALVAAGLLAFVAPTTVLAHQHRHARHHARAHHARLRRFGDPTTSGTSTSGPSSGVGKVTAFDSSSGLLTITLGDGSTVAGTVTPDTEMSCTSGSSSQGDQSSGDDNEPSGSADQGDQQDQGNAGGDSPSGSQQSSGGDENSGGDDDQGEDQGGTGTTGPTGPTGPTGGCSSSDPKGLTVLFAELRLSNAGNTWEKLLLSS